MKSVPLLFASILACAAVAQDEESPAESAAPVAPAKAADEARSVFTTIPYCSFVEGTVEVRKPGGEWTAAEEGVFYPLGSAFRTRDAGQLTLSFGKSATARISGAAMFETKAQSLSVKSRTIVLGEGTLDVDLPDTIPEGMFFVTTPGFTARNLVGSSRYTYAKTATGDRTVVRCVTGSLGVSGRHYDIPQMRAANELVISEEHDHLATTLENRSGDYLVKLDQGSRYVEEVAEDGTAQKKVVSEPQDFKFSPKMKISITRVAPSVGTRLSVFVLAFDAAGNPMGSGVSFCEGRAEVNDGVLVTPTKSADAEKLAKAAAESTETTDEAVAEDDGAAAASSDEAASEADAGDDDDDE